MNVQFAVKEKDVYILEVNPRASRTVPFVAKATGVPIAKIAARVMAGEKLAAFRLPPLPRMRHVAVKEAVFPFARFPGVDVILGPEMKSTGEVMGIDADFRAASPSRSWRPAPSFRIGGRLHVGQGQGQESHRPLARRLTALGFKCWRRREPPNSGRPGSTR